MTILKRPKDGRGETGAHTVTKKGPTLFGPFKENLKESFNL